MCGSGPGSTETRSPLVVFRPLIPFPHPVFTTHAVMSEFGIKSRRQQRIYTKEDVAQHKSEKDCWITYKGVVYNVTAFLADHPGGEEYVLRHAGEDVEAAMADPADNVHSDSAYEMLAEYAVGKLGSGFTTVDDSELHSLTVNLGRRD